MRDRRLPSTIRLRTNCPTVRRHFQLSPVGTEGRRQRPLLAVTSIAALIRTVPRPAGWPLSIGRGIRAPAVRVLDGEEKGRRSAQIPPALIRRPSVNASRYGRCWGDGHNQLGCRLLELRAPGRDRRRGAGDRDPTAHRHRDDPYVVEGYRSSRYRQRAARRRACAPAKRLHDVDAVHYLLAQPWHRFDDSLWGSGPRRHLEWTRAATA